MYARLGSFCLLMISGMFALYAQPAEVTDTLYSENDSIFILGIEQLNDVDEKKMVIKYNERIRKIIEKDRNHPHSQTVVKARFLFSNYLHSKKDYRNALTVLHDILRGPTAISKADSIRLYSHISRIYAELGVFSRAYDFQNHMEEMAGSENLHKNLSLFTKSMLFSKFKMHKKAMEHLRTEFRYIPSSAKKPLTKTSFYNNLGVHWTKLGNADSALVNFRTALAYATQIDSVSDSKISVFFKGLIKGNMGQALMLQKKFKEAIPLLQQDVRTSHKVGEMENAALSQYELARCYLESGLYDVALKYLDSALKVITKKSNYSHYVMLKKCMAEVYFRKGVHDRFNTIMREMQVLEDSVKVNNEYGNVVNNETLLTLFEYEQQIRKKEQAFKQRARLAEQERTWRYYTLVILILLITITVLLIINAISNRKKRIALTKNNRKIHDQNLIIEESLREKDMLIREIHHRVKNNLQMVSSLLNLQSNRVVDDAARTALRESISRIDSMAIIHQQLYGKSDFRTIRIDEYLKQLLTQIERGYGQGTHTIELKMDAQPVVFNLDVAIPVGIIMNEVLTNCYKHAFIKKSTGTIEVKLKVENGKTYVSIADDGDGLPSDFESRRQHSLGQELIVLLVEQLGGTLNITSDKGTKYHIVF